MDTVLMGLNDEHAVRVLLDLETCPLPDAADYLGDVGEAPSNWKDPIKIAAFKAEKRAEQLEKAGLDVDLCRVVCIGLWAETWVAPVVWSAFDEDRMVKEAWTKTNGLHLVGFNIGSFDVPVLLRRSLYLGIKTPMISLDKYRHPRFTDLLQVLTYNGLLKMRGLSFYAKRMGCPVQDETSGADIARLVQAGDWPAVENHCRKDLEKTAWVAEKLGYFTRRQ